ncbi:MAG: hypothetical protein IJY12_00540 [Clostridia bacterium]|nr:hypothetical protein [Clostridia bacterium]
MSSIDLKSIKARSVKAVFHSIASSDKITRAEIAKATDLSLMTVGKIADSFARMGITKEEKEISGNVGRRAAVIRITDLYYGIVLDLTTDDYVCEIVDAGANIIDRFSYAYSFDFYREENQLLFFKNLVLYLSTRYDPEKCIGIGALLPDTAIYAESEATASQTIHQGTQSVERMIQDNLSGYASNLYVGSCTETAAFYTASRVPNHEEKIILYCQLEATPQSALVVHGNIIYGKHGPLGNIGARLAKDAFRADTRGGNRAEEANLAKHCAQAIEDAEQLLSPHIIILEADNHSQEFTVALKKALDTILPKDTVVKIEAGGSRNSHFGVVLQLRNRWIDSIISREI